jgi:hypothetical protein
LSVSGIVAVSPGLSAVFGVFSRAGRVLVAGAARLGVAAAKIRSATGKSLPGVAAGTDMVAGAAIGATVASAGARCASNVDAKPVAGSSEAPESRFGAGLTRSVSESVAGVALVAVAGAAIETVMKQGLPACGNHG